MSIPLTSWPSNLQQPDVVANENNQTLKLLVQLAVEDVATNAPTTVTADAGKAWIVGAGTWPTSGGVTPAQHAVALSTGADSWRYYTPREGWVARNLTTDSRVEFDGSAWGALAGGGSFTGGSLSSALNEAKGTSIASAATTNIAAATGNLVHIAGTTTITALGTAQAGTERVVVFDGALILTHHATALFLPGGINIKTAANDVAIFRSEGAGDWRCIAYAKASGQGLPKTVALTDATNIAVDASLSDSFRVTLAGNRTLDNPSNLRDAQVINLRIVQDATGGRTLAYGSKYKFPGGAAPVLSTAASARDFMCCQYDATADTLFCVLNKGFA